jgi:hypothetical protein
MLSEMHQQLSVQQNRISMFHIKRLSMHLKKREREQLYQMMIVLVLQKKLVLMNLLLLNV